MSDSTTITVEALDERKEFKNADALREHVAGFIGNRVYGPMELAAIRVLAAHGNGDTPEEVARIARNTAIHAPGKPERAPSPLDDRIEAAEERLEEAEAELAEALENRTQVRAGAEAEITALRSKAKGTDAEIGRQVAELRGRLRGRIADANAEYLRIREGRTRACARVNALKVARDRWYATEALELHET